MSKVRKLLFYLLKNRLKYELNVKYSGKGG